MTTAAVLLAAGGGSRFHGADHKLRAELGGIPVLRRAVDAVIEAAVAETIVVVGEDSYEDVLPGGVTVLQVDDWADGQSRSLQAAVRYAREQGHDAIVVGLADQPLVGTNPWQVLAGLDAELAVANFGGKRRPPTRIGSTMWDALPTTGDEGARSLLKQHRGVVDVVVTGDPIDVDTVDALTDAEQRLGDLVAVRELLGREPMGYFDVVVRGDEGEPVVLRNFPILADGRPMPTLYWLCGERETMLVGRLEADRGVRRAEEAIGLPAITATHERYADERDLWLADSQVTAQHRPSGGVGGTRMGVKCLHAHYGYFLAGGDDPVGAWVADHLHEVDRPDWPARS